MALIPVSAEIQRKSKLHPQKVGWELATGDSGCSGLGDSFLLTLAQTRHHVWAVALHAVTTIPQNSAAKPLRRHSIARAA